MSARRAAAAAVTWPRPAAISVRSPVPLLSTRLCAHQHQQQQYQRQARTLLTRSTAHSSLGALSGLSRQLTRAARRHRASLSKGKGKLKQAKEQQDAHDSASSSFFGATEAATRAAAWPLKRALGLEAASPLDHRAAAPRLRHKRARRAARIFAIVALAAVGTWSTVLYLGREGMLAQGNKKKRQLSYKHYAPVTLESVSRLNAETALFRFVVDAAQLPDPDELAPGPIKAIYVKQPELQIQRPYTPLSSALSPSQPVIELAVKRYDNGELSRWMHRLQPGDQVELRGPVVSWTPPATLPEEIDFIVGGTGMTTAYQFIEHLASRASQASTSTTSTSNPSSSSAGPSQPSRVRILYAARSSDALFLADELLQLAKRCAPLADVSVRLWTDKAASQEQEHDQRSSSWSPWSWWRAGGPTQPATRFLDDEHIRAFLDSSSPTTSSSAEPSSGDKSRLVLVCGPDRMIETVAGPRDRTGAQGPVGGILGRLGYGSDKVVKL